MDLFGIALALIVGVIVLFVARTARLTRAQVDQRLRGTDPRRRADVARDLATRMRAQADEVKCVRCGGSTFMIPGTDDAYKCEVCHFTFAGPPHTPDAQG